MSRREPGRRRPTGPVALAIVGLGALVAVLIVSLGRGSDGVAPPTAPPTSVSSAQDSAAFFLEVTNPPQAESLTEAPTLLVEGRTRLDAVVSVNDVITAPDVDGRFSVELTLEEVLAVIYLPP